MLDFLLPIFTISPFMLLKIGVLLLLLLYVVFSVIITVQARAFHRVVYVGDSSGSFFIQFLSIIHLLAAISLFIAAVAIL